MPPAPNAAFAPSRIQQQPLGTSPDTDTIATELEEQPRLSKKKKKDRNAKHQTSNVAQRDAPDNLEIGTGVLPPDPSAPRSVLSQIPPVFSHARRNTLDVEGPEERDDGPTSEKVSDQYTPPGDNWLQDVTYNKSLQKDTTAVSSLADSPPIQPGFSTRGGYITRSPPISPPQRYSRPISYGGGVPLVPSHRQMSTSPYSQTPSLYGSPPAPHLPQPHFYHAQDVDVGRSRNANPQYWKEPTLVKRTRIPSARGDHEHGLLLGFEGRISIFQTDLNNFEEVGALVGFQGVVVDAVLLPEEFGANTFAATKPLIAIVVHGPKIGIEAEMPQPTAPQAGIEYVTRVAIYSLSQQKLVENLLETPATMMQHFRITGDVPPPPIGALKLYASNQCLLIVSGTSGEVFIFSPVSGDVGTFECLGKLWTTVQPQIQRRDRRDSSHSRASDTDLSPADANRGAEGSERAIIDLNGRWLVTCPTALPCRPSLGAKTGTSVLFQRNGGLESNTAPSRPSITCDVDSPDADTLFGKVARGVAQELVKGAKWLGDQGYQTWQSYWRKEQSSTSTVHSQQSYAPSAYINSHYQSAFPPTHGDTTQISKEAELVSVYDLKALQETLIKRPTEEIRPIATFRPPRGCSFVSVAPHGLTLLTAGRKGDVQYVWDLMQVKYPRAYLAGLDDDPLRAQPRVRQIARFDRLSGSTIVDIAWDSMLSSRFAILTTNRTVHMFDIPPSALRWPPPRGSRKPRASPRSFEGAAGAEQDNNQSVGFLASAMNIASKAQPMVASWRGRAPSMSGGLAGLGSTSIGIASATGARGGKAVAAGLSKSLGAASDTVNHIRHAGESRIHLKFKNEAVAGRIFWARKDRKPVLVVLDADFLKFYRVRQVRPTDRRTKDGGSVFDSSKARSSQLPKSHNLRSDFLGPSAAGTGPDSGQENTISGMWRSRAHTVRSASDLHHPLSFAEIETNSPYQPFHSDRRVTLSIFSNSEEGSFTTHGSDAWAFGGYIPAVKLNTSKARPSDDESADTGSVIYRETTVTTTASGDHDMEQIVSTTRRSKKKRGVPNRQSVGSDEEKDDFFEDDCEVLDFATDRV